VIKATALGSLPLPLLSPSIFWLPFTLQFIPRFGAFWARTASSVRILTVFRQQEGSWALSAARTGNQVIN